MGNNSHIEFDELVEFCIADTLDAAFVEKAARINAHLVKCEECMHDYELLQAAEQSFDKCTDLADDNKAKADLLEGIYRSERNYNLDSVSVQKCVNIFNRMKSKIMVTIENVDTIICRKLDEVSDAFRYPQLATAAVKSVSANELNQDAAHDIKSIMLDSRRNRIGIDVDRTLSVFIRIDECPADALVALISMSTKPETRFMHAKQYDKEYVVARFEDVECGTYKIAISE